MQFHTDLHHSRALMQVQVPIGIHNKYRLRLKHTGMNRYSEFRTYSSSREYSYTYSLYLHSVQLYRVSIKFLFPEATKKTFKKKEKKSQLYNFGTNHSPEIKELIFFSIFQSMPMPYRLDFIDTRCITNVLPYTYLRPQLRMCAIFSTLYAV